MTAFDVNLYLTVQHLKVSMRYAEEGFIDSASNRRTGWVNTERVLCADGFSISVQASASHYCTPRTAYGLWTHFELGFPSAPCPELADFDDGGSGVYAQVPLEVVSALIAAHGGIRRV